MKLNELRTGDMVIMRNAVLGLILVKGSEIYLMYEEAAWHSGRSLKRPYPKSAYADIRDFVTEDLQDAAGGSDHDVMQVLRKEQGMIDFESFDEGELIYERDRTWERPPVKFFEKLEWNRFKTNVGLLERKAEDGAVIFMTHGFPHAFVVDTTHYMGESFMERRFLDSDLILNKIKNHLRHVLIPGTEDLYITYSTFYENRARPCGEEEITVVIPELDLELCSPCIVYRKDQNGTYRNLTEEDGKILFRYFTVRDCVISNDICDAGRRFPELKERA